MKQSFILSLALASISIAAPAYSTPDTSAISTATPLNGTVASVPTATASELPVNTTSPVKDPDVLSRMLGVSSSKIAFANNDALSTLAKVNLSDLTPIDESLLNQIIDLIHKLLESLLGSMIPGGLPSVGLPSVGLPSAALPSAVLPSEGLPSAALPSAAVPSTVLESRQLGPITGILGQLPIIGPLLQGLLGSLTGGGLSGLTGAAGGLTGGLSGLIPGLGGNGSPVSGAAGVVPTGLAGGVGGILGGLPIIGGKFKAQDIKVTDAQLDMARQAENLINNLVANVKAQGLVN
ncbi:uncharacterized protein E0L32_000726 [Thyridium curvatum]|uniref:Uncharacterized protein n=1 Tax=Thyridium curvatum TaxID=1093900 RepID=A0A507B5B9_9PEZI|nr:uncharacterized protein E0L32_000726 [Thyridium curvatum]TPX12549.1 hypothetical protein E0L32_000726 [Thyridium curvatum]